MMADDYFYSRSGLGLFHNELNQRTCKIAFLGNSVTAQKEGYKKYLSEKLDEESKQKHQYINAGIGGVGSLASAFLTDDFVLRYQPDLCFVECTVADIGSATPEQYISASVEGIVKKLLKKNIKVCFLHLYNSHTSEDRKNSIISLYEKIITAYQLPSINISKALSKMIENGEEIETEVVYDGIHTTPRGAAISAKLIYDAFYSICKQQFHQSLFTSEAENITNLPFEYTQIVLPNSSMIESPDSVLEKRFRSIIKYIEIKENAILRFVHDTGELVGVLIIADEESGVVSIETNSNTTLVQTFDQWCDRERIQAITLDQSVLAGTSISISLSVSEEGGRGANGTPNTFKKRGQSLKIIGLMVVFKNEPENKIGLW